MMPALLAALGATAFTVLTWAAVGLVVAVFLYVLATVVREARG